MPFCAETDHLFDYHGGWPNEESKERFRSHSGTFVFQQVSLNHEEIEGGVEGGIAGGP